MDTKYKDQQIRIPRGHYWKFQGFYAYATCSEMHNTHATVHALAQKQLENS